MEVRRAFRAALDNIRLSWKDQSTHTPRGGAAVVPSAPSEKGKGGEVKSKWVWALLLSVLGAAVYGGTVLATPPSGLTNVPLARGIDVSNGTIPLQVGTDVAMSKITVIPGGSSGWHSHPGGAIIVVKTGTLTVYKSVGSQCQTTTYSATGVHRATRRSGRRPQHRHDPICPLRHLPARPPGRLRAN